MAHVIVGEIALQCDYFGFLQEVSSETLFRAVHSVSDQTNQRASVFSGYFRSHCTIITIRIMTEFFSKFIKRGREGTWKGKREHHDATCGRVRVSAFSYTCRINAEHHCRPNLDIMMIVPSVFTGESSFVYDVYFIALLQ